MPSRSPRRTALVALTSVVLLVGLIALLGSCRQDPGGFTAPSSTSPFPTGPPSPSGPVLLTQDQATSALLTSGDLGGAVQPMSRKTALQTPPCLTKGSDRDGAGTVVAAQFTAANQEGFGEQLFSFADADAARKAFASVTRQVDACRKVSLQISPGVTARLRAVTNHEQTVDAVDEQVNFALVGTFESTTASGGTVRLPAAFYYSTVRVNNNTLVLSAFTIGQSDGSGTSSLQVTTQLKTYLRIVVARMRAAVIKAG